MEPVPRLIIDTGGGIDGALALLFALCDPGVAVHGITTVSGDSDADQAADQALRLIGLCLPEAEEPPPVAVGEAGPLARERDGPWIAGSGRNGFGGAMLPPPKGKAAAEPAAAFLASQAAAFPGELTLVLAGPVTNWPRALEMDSHLAEKFKRIVVAGGAVFAAGNATPVAERNFHADPEAAERLFATAGGRLTVVGLDVTMRARIRGEHLERLSRGSPPERERIVAFMRRMLNHSFAYYRRTERWLEAAPLGSALALVAAAEPGLFRTGVFRASVDTQAGLTAGMVVADRRARASVGREVCFCVETDEERAVERFLSAFS
ncbi:nucleoside hydrolase [Cohnella massiliensis]|uniref:nucleoside hydrolase n=1 Tax=Cohnella massiliensis TaxID=1816691 RepID=UPI0009BABFE2|nr:nucleoside hydrolase [Cohnella massiliensis]